MYHFTTVLFILFMTDELIGRYKVCNFLYPFLVQFVCGTRNCFIRSGCVNTTHQDITEYQTVHTFLDQRSIQLKSRIGFQTAQVQ